MSAAPAARTCEHPATNCHSEMMKPEDLIILQRKNTFASSRSNIATLMIGGCGSG